MKIIVDSRNGKDRSLTQAPLCASENFVDLPKTGLRMKMTAASTYDSYICTDYTVQIYAESELTDTSFSIVLEQQNWEKQNYVFAPAAAYNGNRFKSVPLAYPPISIGVVDDVENPEIVITDVPRLSDTKKQSEIELKVGDMSKPLFGYFSLGEKKAYFILFEQQSIAGMDNSICVSEDLDAHTAEFSVVIPARRKLMYRFMSSCVESTDKGVSLLKGDEVSVRFRVYDLPCESIIEYYDIFSKLRYVFDKQTEFKNTVPFSKAFQAVEDKYNRINWVSDYRFYRSSAAESSICSQWQTGWVGGGMSTYPVLTAGGKLSKERSVNTIDFIFSKILSDNGLMYGIFYDGEVYGDSIDPSGNKNHLLMRKFTDAVYFLLKQFFLCKEQNQKLPEIWENGLRRSLDTLSEIFEVNGQFGQFVDIQTKKLIVRGTSSAATGIAALALGWQYYKDKRYLDSAKAAGEYYFTNYAAKGISNGGPGEICQCPDSESIFGLLESYMALYDVTAEQHWAEYAKVCADIASSWCVAYDFRFPVRSQFHKRGIHATGTVWASIQNKHSAPGICTLSGVSLLKLYRATGDEKYLFLLREISHSLTQFVSLKENPFYFSYGGAPTTLYNPDGFAGERVNLSDWEGEENVGELPNGSCWDEVSMLLNYVDNPGVYIVKDLDKVIVLDHINAEILRSNEDELFVELSNNTIYDCVVTVFDETSLQQKNPMKCNPWGSYQKVYINANSSVRLLIKK